MEQESNDQHHSHDHTQHHQMMIRDFKKRFWISLIITLPVLALSTMIQQILGFQFTLIEQVDPFILLGLSTIIFFYGGWPFLTGLASEVKQKQPGMMTLIAVAITVAWGYSAATTLGHGLQCGGHPTGSRCAVQRRHRHQPGTWRSADEPVQDHRGHQCPVPQRQIED